MIRLARGTARAARHPQPEPAPEPARDVIPFARPAVPPPIGGRSIFTIRRGGDRELELVLSVEDGPGADGSTPIWALDDGRVLAWSWRYADAATTFGIVGGHDR